MCRHGCRSRNPSRSCWRKTGGRGTCGVSPLGVGPGRDGGACPVAGGGRAVTAAEGEPSGVGAPLGLVPTVRLVTVPIRRPCPSGAASTGTVPEPASSGTTDAKARARQARALDLDLVGKILTHDQERAPVSCTAGGEPRRGGGQDS